MTTADDDGTSRPAPRPGRASDTPGPGRTGDDGTSRRPALGSRRVGPAGDDGTSRPPSGVPGAGRSRDAGWARLGRAALRAERVTGTRERSDDQARRGVLARLAIISFGSLVTVLGVILMPLPGPGIVVVLAGLGILATEVAWAERALAYAKRRSKVDALTAQAPWLKPASITVTVIGTVVSLLYTFRWRS